MEVILPWLVHWLVVPVQDISFNFNSFVPTSRQAGQAAMLG
jgi:hypothetical protein